MLPTEIGDLKAVPGADLATLFTCTPYAVNSHRLLVRGHRVAYDGQTAAAVQAVQAPGASFEPWMTWLIGGAAGSITALVILVLLAKRRRTKRPPSEAIRARDPEPVGADVT